MKLHDVPAEALNANVLFTAGVGVSEKKTVHRVYLI